MSPQKLAWRHSSASVGVILANGWLGRPYDTHDQIDTFSLSKSGSNSIVARDDTLKCEHPGFPSNKTSMDIAVLSLSKKRRWFGRQSLSQLNKSARYHLSCLLRLVIAVAHLEVSLLCWLNRRARGRRV